MALSDADVQKQVSSFNLYRFSKYDLSAMNVCSRKSIEWMGNCVDLMKMWCIEKNLTDCMDVSEVTRFQYFAICHMNAMQYLFSYFSSIRFNIEQIYRNSKIIPMESWIDSKFASEKICKFDHTFDWTEKMNEWCTVCVTWSKFQWIWHMILH